MFSIVHSTFHLLSLDAAASSHSWANDSGLCLNDLGMPGLSSYSAGFVLPRCAPTAIEPGWGRKTEINVLLESVALPCLRSKILWEEAS